MAILVTDKEFEALPRGSFDSVTESVDRSSSTSARSIRSSEAEERLWNRDPVLIWWLRSGTGNAQQPGRRRKAYIAPVSPNDFRFACMQRKHIVSGPPHATQTDRLAPDSKLSRFVGVREPNRRVANV